MRDAIVLGCGRSGTSMLAGILHERGWFLGEDLYVEPRASNPKGFFEDREVNNINEELLAEIDQAGPMTWGHRWLAAVPLRTELRVSPQLEARMHAVTRRHPWCLKDPRFCYTLPAWRAAAGSAVRLCIFRHPAQTANSILQECRDETYLEGVDMDYRRAVDLWALMYQHVLSHAEADDWMFVHFAQCLDGSALPRLGEVLEAEFREGFADPVLDRSPTHGDVPDGALDVYARLCGRAGYRHG